MSGKKKDAKLAHDKKAKPKQVKVTKIIEFRRKSSGALAPKSRWEREVIDG